MADFAVWFNPRPSDAASTVGPVTIPTTPAEIRADVRKHELGLAAKGLAEYRQELVRTHQPSLSAAERAAELNRLEKTVRAQLAKPLTRAPAVPAGLHPDKSGGGPWGSCACTVTDPAATPTAGYGAIIEFTYNLSPPSGYALIRSPFNSPLVIVSAHGDSVELRTLSGQRLTFNVVTQKFGT